MNLRTLLKSASSIVILGHHNADPDAICSMVSFGELYHSIRPDGQVTFTCDDVSRVAVQVIDIFYNPVEITSELNQDADLYVLLDTNSRYQLGLALEESLNFPSKTLVIDHHEANPDVGQVAEHTIVETEKSSTCEILVNLFNELDIDITPQIANLLLAGMLFDTRRFFYADRQTLKVALDLIDLGADYHKCIESLIVRPDKSERIARLKAAGRLRINDIEGWLIVVSKIGAYEASSCRGLIDLGADVAIVGGHPSKGAVRLSSRSTTEFYRMTDINLGTDVMEPLGELIDGEGGGHSNAAGANGKRNLEEALNRSVELIRKALEKQSTSKETS